MENFITNTLDCEIEVFCEKLSAKFNKNKWELFALHKWGNFDYEDKIIEKNGELFITDSNNEVYAKLINWVPEPFL